MRATVDLKTCAAGFPISCPLSYLSACFFKHPRIDGTHPRETETACRGLHDDSSLVGAHRSFRLSLNPTLWPYLTPACTPRSTISSFATIPSIKVHPQLFISRDIIKSALFICRKHFLLPVVVLCGTLELWLWRSKHDNIFSVSQKHENILQNTVTFHKRYRIPINRSTFPKPRHVVEKWN